MMTRYRTMSRCNYRFRQLVRSPKNDRRRSQKKVNFCRKEAKSERDLPQKSTQLNAEDRKWSKIGDECFASVPLMPVTECDSIRLRHLCTAPAPQWCAGLSPTSTTTQLLLQFTEPRMPFVVKPTYRLETRKFTFNDGHFPTWDELCHQVCN